MAIVKIGLADNTVFTEDKPVSLPIGDTVVQTRTAEHQKVPQGESVVGFWECTTGRFRRQVPQAEYSYILRGEGSFTPEGEEPVDFGPGDALYFDANTDGVWEVRKSILKAYIIIS